MRFSRQEYWSGLPFLSPGDLPNPGIKPRSPALQVDSLPTSYEGSPSSSLETLKKEIMGFLYSLNFLCWLSEALFNKRKEYMNDPLNEVSVFWICDIISLRPFLGYSSNELD